MLPHDFTELRRLSSAELVALKDNLDKQALAVQPNARRHALRAPT